MMECEPGISGKIRFTIQISVLIVVGVPAAALEHLWRRQRSRNSPPGMAEFLLTLFATTPRAEAAIGDLNERFADECKKLGRQRALRLYWARTLRSLWPLLRRAIGKMLKWGVVIATVRRLF
jgi:hypothetical protein